MQTIVLSNSQLHYTYLGGYESIQVDSEKCDFLHIILGSLICVGIIKGYLVKIYMDNLWSVTKHGIFDIFRFGALINYKT